MQGAPRGGGAGPRRTAPEGPGIFLQAAQEFESSEEDRESSCSPEKEDKEREDEREEEPPSAPAATVPEQALPGDVPPAPAASDPRASQAALAAEDIRRLMTECGLGLEAVVQALLKNSGEVGAAACCLRTGVRPDGAPLWSRQDDRDLLRGERDLRQRLERSFGAENVAKREAFRRS